MKKGCILSWCISSHVYGDVTMQFKTRKQRFSMDEAAVVLLCRLLCGIFCLVFWLDVYRLITKVFS